MIELTLIDLIPEVYTLDDLQKPWLGGLPSLEHQI